MISIFTVTTNFNITNGQEVRTQFIFYCELRYIDYIFMSQTGNETINLRRVEKANGTIFFIQRGGTIY